MIRVLHIIKSLGRGGAETLLPETLKLHDRSQFEFHYVYFLPWKNQMVSDLVERGGKVTCIPANNNIQLLLRMGDVVRYIRRHNIQVIHAHLPWAGILSRLAGKWCGVPVVYTEHNKQERYHYATRAMNLVSMNLQQMVIAVSNDVAESIKRNKPRIKTEVYTLLNAVDTDFFERGFSMGNDVKAVLRIPVDAQVIGTVAVFRTQKRLDIWMKIAKRILDDHPNVHFIIVGDGPLKNDLLSLRDSLKLNDRVHMPGLQTDVRPYLRAFDVFMITSVFEGLPIALLEAMSMKCCVISTRAGGIGEVITHSKEGLLCDVNEVDLLASYAHKLLTDHKLRIQIGLAARERVVSRFGMSGMVASLENVYKRLLQRVTEFN